jgi:cell division protein FtsL
MQYNGSAQKRKISFNRLNKRLFLANSFLLAIFFISQIAVTSIVGTKSSEIENIRTEKDRLRLENEILTAQIDEAKSVDRAKDVISKYDLQEKQVNVLNEGNDESVASINR